MTKVKWRVEKARINGVYYNEPHVYTQKTKDVEKFAKTHNVIAVYNETTKTWEAYKK